MDSGNNQAQTSIKLYRNRQHRFFPTHHKPPLKHTHLPQAHTHACPCLPAHPLCTQHKRSAHTGTLTRVRVHRHACTGIHTCAQVHTQAHMMCTFKPTSVCSPLSPSSEGRVTDSFPSTPATSPQGQRAPATALAQSHDYIYLKGLEAPEAVGRGDECLALFVTGMATTYQDHGHF